MNYELCKKLKDAKFPVPKSIYSKERYDKWMDEDGNLFMCQNNVSDCYNPTLAELIESCGDKFYSLVRMVSEDKIWWNAHGVESSFGKTSCSGSTPVEAVARLWLALNSK